MQWEEEGGVAVVVKVVVGGAEVGGATGLQSGPCGGPVSRHARDTCMRAHKAAMQVLAVPRSDFSATPKLHRGASSTPPLPPPSRKRAMKPEPDW